jgi:hypothetical protein
VRYLSAPKSRKKLLKLATTFATVDPCRRALARGDIRSLTSQQYQRRVTKPSREALAVRARLAMSFVASKRLCRLQNGS